MTAPISPIWTAPAPDFRPELQAGIGSGCDRFNGKVKVFFRADDVGVPSRNFTRLLGLFGKYRAPLALAVVPAWLTIPRWRQIQAIADAHGPLWCWHQHGWRHANHEPAGKKSEFGPHRTESGINSDLERGRERMESILGNSYFPVFTPPWNRCDRRTLNILSKQGFLAISRSLGALPKPPDSFPDLSVHIDLHTRKGICPSTDRRLLLNEIAHALAAGSCGFMLHHQRMNDAAFAFLEALLQALSDCPKVKPVWFKKLV
jgi:polysaccharide deacetylase